MEKYVPPFKLNNKMLSLVASITEKLGKISSFEDLKKYPVLRKQNRIKSVHSSCAIEENSLSLDQATDVINGVRVVGPVKDIVEILNAYKAYEKIDKINPFSEEDLKRIHLIFGNEVVNNPGKYRTRNEGVTDEDGNVVFVAPPPNLVPSLMESLFAWTKSEFKNINPLILSSVFHYEFVFIHPFSDGNGRLVRFWQNALLGKWKPIFYWLPIENQIKKYQDSYYKAISQSHIDGESTAFILFMLKMIDKSLDELIINTDTIDKSFSIYQAKMLNKLSKNTWYTSNQILELLDLKSKETLRKNYLDPAIKNGLMILEFPEKPTSRNQRYKIVK